MAMIGTKPNSTQPTLIAACGINCRLCRAYVREKKACPGCRGEDTNKTKIRIACRIKNCEKMLKGKFEYCFECDEFPCPRLSHLDKRYRTNYGTSVLDNLASIKNIGILNFVETENSKWACPECGAMLCMHHPECLSCGTKWH
jgi:hypothetical protein